MSRFGRFIQVFSWKKCHHQHRKFEFTQEMWKRPVYRQSEKLFSSVFAQTHLQRGINIVILFPTNTPKCVTSPWSVWVWAQVTWVDLQKKVVWFTSTKLTLPMQRESQLPCWDCWTQHTRHWCEPSPNPGADSGFFTQGCGFLFPAFNGQNASRRVLGSCPSFLCYGDEKLGPQNSPWCVLSIRDTHVWSLKHPQKYLHWFCCCWPTTTAWLFSVGEPTGSAMQKSICLNQGSARGTRCM